ncbi:MAG: ribosome maturation factor [Desulfuromonas sp.]|nr:MAG: ribosome maturation factor [Desulfuromonas sp.]
MKRSLVDELLDLIEPVLEDMAYELVDLEFKQEGPEWFLRIFIDKDGGVGLDDCASVSREIGALLEVEDIIEPAYRLEVSSPGLDRPLKKPQDFERFAEHRVKVKTINLVDPDGRGYERKTFTGILQGVHDGRIRIEQTDKKGGEVEIALTEIGEANLDPEF